MEFWSLQVRTAALVFAVVKCQRQAWHVRHALPRTGARQFMVIFGTRQRAAERRRQSPGILSVEPYFYKSEWMETGEDTRLAPNVFLVEQPPTGELPVHFHTQNQFQVFIEGHGHVGKTPVQAVMVHYAGAYTAYGPLRSPPDGWMKYFTLRAAYDSGAKVLPERRDILVDGPKRMMHSEPLTPLDETELAQLVEARQEDLIPPQTDQLHSFIWYLPPKAKVIVPPAAPGGQFLMLLAGCVEVQDNVMQPWETAYTDVTPKGLECAAGSSGAALLVMQMPAMEAVYRAAVSRLS